MPAGFISALGTIGEVAGAVGAVSSLVGGGGGGGGGAATGSGQPTYVPTGLAAADSNWQNANNTIYSMNSRDYNAANPYLNNLPFDYNLQQQGVGVTQAQDNYLGNIANGQMQTYAGNAQGANSQNQTLDYYSNQMLNKSFDPNRAQFQQSQNDLTNQVNAGQALRGLGNSAEGASEYNNAMQNFDIGWNTQQLQNEQIGIQGAAQGNNAAINQGQYAGNQLQNQISSGNQMIGYNQNAYNLPLQTNQANMQALASGYGNQASQVIPYINNGQGAQGFNAQYGSAQNASAVQALGNLGSQYGGAISNFFGGSPNSAAMSNNYSNVGSYNAPTTDLSNSASSDSSASNMFNSGGSSLGGGFYGM